MSKKALRFILIAMMLCGALPAFAQGDTLPNSYFLDWAGVSFRYADGWEIAENDQGSIYLTAGTAELFPDWYPPELLAEYGVEVGDVAGVMQNLQFNPMDQTITFDPAAIQVVKIDGRQVYTYEFTDTDEAGSYTMLLGAMAVSDGTVFTANIYPTQSDAVPATLRDEALQTLASFNIEPVVTPTYVFEESGIGVVLPETWQVFTEDNGYVRFESEETYFDPYWYSADDAAGDVAAVLQAVATGVDASFDVAAVQEIDVNGHTVVMVTYNDTFENNNVDYTGIIAGTLLSDGTVFAADIYPTYGSEVTELDVALDVIASAQSGTSADTAQTDTPADTAALTEWFDLDGAGLGFYYPADWTVQTSDSDFTYIVDDVTGIDPYYITPENFADYGVKAGNPGTAIMALLNSWDAGAGVDVSTFEMVPVNGRDLVIYKTQTVTDTETYDTWYGAVEAENGSMVVMDIYPLAGTDFTEGDLALEMLASVTSN
jgi:hypothetical protein